jgi:hypothetical protein
LFCQICLKLFVIHKQDPLHPGFHHRMIQQRFGNRFGQYRQIDIEAAAFPGLALNGHPPADGGHNAVNH